MFKSKFYQVPSRSSVFYIKNLEVHKLIILHQRLLISFRYSCNHLWFNTSCKRSKVFPNYISATCKTKNYQATKAMFRMKQIWLAEEIKKHYKRRDNLSMHLKIIHSQLSILLHNVELDYVFEKHHDKANYLSHIQYMRQRSKLDRLIFSKQTTYWRASNQRTINFHPRVINLSSCNLTSDETSILRNGFNYAPDLGIQSRHLIDLAVHLDAALDETCDDADKAEFVRIIREGKINRNRASQERITIGNLKRKIARENLVVCKADKGNSVTVLDKRDYINKMIECIDSMKVIELKSDPTLKYQKELIQVVNNSKRVLSEGERFRVKNSNPSAPILYGLPKIHKPGVPIRPVASSVNSPTQKLCSLLCKVIPEIINFKPKFSIKNTSDLVNKIKDFNIPPNAKLVSFDVCSLFPSVPVEKCFGILRETILGVVRDRHRALEYLELIKVCLKQNYFKFNDKFYQQDDGLAMGSALSPFVAEFFMDHLEKHLFSSGLNLVSHVHSWFRYVDDVLCIWTGSERQLKKFLDDVLNKLDDNIKFTLEMGMKQINFLDVTIMIRNNRLEFKIFRKETFTDIVIPSRSLHSWSTKMAAFHCLLNRLILIPMSRKDFKAELFIIKQIGANNGYSKRTIHKLLDKKLKKKTISQFFPVYNSRQRGVWKKIPYIKDISEKMKHPLKIKNITPAFFNKNTLKRLLGNNNLTSNSINALEKSGVYKISCGDCDAVYIGKTKRKLKIRLREHISGTSLNSNVAKHLHRYKHNLNEQNIKLLHNLPGGRVLDKYEIREIRKAKRDGYFLLNDQLDFANRSPLLNPSLF